MSSDFVTSALSLNKRNASHVAGISSHEEVEFSDPSSREECHVWLFGFCLTEFLRNAKIHA